MNYKQGEIVLVPFPFTDQTASKLRPALVISGSAYNKSSDVVLVQITSNNRKDSFSVAIDNSNDLTNPLRFISEIRCNKIFVADQSLIIKVISQVKPKVVTQVIAKINTIFNP